ncbi:hypothetical protein P106B_49 [Rhizobium phage vB_RglS_P106B]|uniref:Uncharacterized protein n=1 Tax=Rhizobium phage vB_RglS_P106B TaxID=1458697 RepID=W6EC26_9CAUD|nr:hypothetical protein P106B_49 [Rhizobium phage vB_RglS_P106B]AHJ10732.1 hypothetical protein P106B_49 [Rhizobium phage vB_RglS_P106B]
MFANIVKLIVALIVLYLAFRALYMKHTDEKRKAVATILSIAFFTISIFLLTQITW